MRLIRWLESSVLVSALTGCVPLLIPIPFPKFGTPVPFQGYSDLMRVGKTTQTDMIAHLGAPTIMRRGGERFFAYVAEQHHGAVCFPVLVLPLLLPVFEASVACLDKNLEVGFWSEFPRTVHLLSFGFDE
jgi:hypothetical protein